MKLEFAKFLTIVLIGVTLSVWGGAALSSPEAATEKPIRVEVQILETAGPGQEPGAPLPV